MAEATTLKAKHEQGYWAFVNKQFRKKKTAVISLYIVVALALVAVFAPFLANEKPLVCKYKGETYFPVLKELAFLYIKEKILKIGNEISIHTIAFSTNSEYAISKRDLIT